MRLDAIYLSIYSRTGLRKNQGSGRIQLLIHHSHHPGRIHIIRDVADHAWVPRLLDERRRHEPVAQEVRDGAHPERRVDALPRIAENVPGRAGGCVVVDDWTPAACAWG